MLSLCVIIFMTHYFDSITALEAAVLPAKAFLSSYLQDLLQYMHNAIQVP